MYPGLCIYVSTCPHLRLSINNCLYLTQARVRAGMISRHDVKEITLQLEDAKQLIEQQEIQIRQHAAKIEDLSCRTPRPEWPAILSNTDDEDASHTNALPHVYAPTHAHASTQARVTAAAGRVQGYKTELDVAHAHIDLLQSLLAPEAVAKELRVLWVDDGAAAFVTQSESNGSDEEGSQGVSNVQAMGLQPSVPRMLRWNYQVRCDLP